MRTLSNFEYCWVFARNLGVSGKKNREVPITKAGKEQIKIKRFQDRNEKFPVTYSIFMGMMVQAKTKLLNEIGINKTSCEFDLECFLIICIQMYQCMSTLLHPYDFSKGICFLIKEALTIFFLTLVLNFELC